MEDISDVKVWYVLFFACGMLGKLMVFENVFDIRISPRIRFVCNGSSVSFLAEFAAWDIVIFFT